MYIAGVFLLGLGIAVLPMCVAALVHAPGPDHVIGFLVCTAVVPVPMIVVGIALIRRAEDRVTTGDSMPVGSPARPRAGPAGVMDRALAFDLNRLNWAGWLLLFGTFGFFGAEVMAVGWTWPGGWDRRLVKLVAPPLVLLPIGFFAGTRWVLARLGVSIYRRSVRKL